MNASLIFAIGESGVGHSDFTANNSFQFAYGTKIADRLLAKVTTEEPKSLLNNRNVFRTPKTGWCLKQQRIPIYLVWSCGIAQRGVMRIA
ncbi:hypothetical protein [Xanthomonas sp. BRIP62409]|uniref:hypothetical protein n=1 Tax=Xanthomonas sp. BRIP62409 TaxID=2182388 RepID=UPI000F8E7BFF|nr:hypothetical protein [Xanthomonas sp. BRIP62409]